MFLRSILIRKKRSKERTAHPRLLILLAVVIVSAVVLLRFLSWLDRDDRSLLTWAPGLVMLEDVERITEMAPMPTKTFEAELYTAGIYTQTTNVFPQDTIALVYVKDDWRFVEIDYIPGMNTQSYLATHIFPTDEITLTDDQSAWILTIDSRPRCIDYEDEIPNRCEISRHLITDLDDRLLLIAADGDHVSDGELIEMAREIVVDR